MEIISHGKMITLCYVPSELCLSCEKVDSDTAPRVIASRELVRTLIHRRSPLTKGPAGGTWRKATYQMPLGSESESICI